MPKTFPILFIAIFGVGLLVGAGTGFLLSSPAPPPALPPPAEPELPLPPVFIQHPVVDQFFANAEGRVAAKNDDSFTLENNGKQLTVLVEIQSSQTAFGELTPEGEKQISFTEVRVGDYLKGGVSVLKEDAPIGFSKPRARGAVIAHRFSVTHQ